MSKPRAPRISITVRTHLSHRPSCPPLASTCLSPSSDPSPSPPPRARAIPNPEAAVGGTSMRASQSQSQSIATINNYMLLRDSVIPHSTCRHGGDRRARFQYRFRPQEGWSLPPTSMAYPACCLLTLASIPHVIPEATRASCSKPSFCPLATFPVELRRRVLTCI